MIKEVSPDPLQILLLHKNEVKNFYFYFKENLAKLPKRLTFTLNVLEKNTNEWIPYQITILNLKEAFQNKLKVKNEQLCHSIYKIGQYKII